MREYMDISGFEAIEPDLPQLVNRPLAKVDVNSSEPEINGELTANQPQFPATQREIAQYFSVSPAAIGKWVKALEQAGVKVTTKSRKITSEGFEMLCNYSQAGDRAYFLECLQASPQASQSSALAVRSESNLTSYGINFDDVFATIEADYNALDGCESQTAQELAIYEAELVEFSENFATKEERDRAILLRKEAEKAAKLAKEVHQVKQAAYHQTLQRLEAKSTNFR
jgi:DNA-binding Lrp family transcriptional regulator